MAKKKLTKEFFRKIAKLGGERTSKKKREALLRNMAKARAARWPSKKKKGGAK